jgi:hypothetical protein
MCAASAHRNLAQILENLLRAAREPGALGRAAQLVSGLSFTVRRDSCAMEFFVPALVDGFRGAVLAIDIALPTAFLFLAWFSSELAGLESGRCV